MDMVVSKDIGIINKLLKDERMTGRQNLPGFDHLRYGDKQHSMKGLIFSQGKEWSEHRRFTLKNLRDFGFGKSSMNEMIFEEVEKFKVLTFF